jgi:hypothetical protein
MHASESAAVPALMHWCNHDRAARIVAYFMVRAGHPTMDRCTHCWPVPCSKGGPGAEVVKSYPEETGGRVDVISGYICTVERLEREASSVPRLPTGVCGQPMGCAGRRGKRRSHVGAGRTGT